MPEFDDSERPTRPDLGARCPQCAGQGDCLVDISEDPARVRMARRRCSLCDGKKILTREDFARYLAGRRR